MRILVSSIVISILFGSYQRLVVANNGLGTARLATVGPASTPMPPSSACHVSRTIRDKPPKDPNADAPGLGDWFVNEDRTIWVEKALWQAGSDGNKVYWVRPAATKLVVTGRRIGAPAPPPRATADEGYPTGFTVTGLYFESPGCWELSAKAGTKELHFVTEVVAPTTASASP
jgi:hypothetical protein